MANIKKGFKRIETILLGILGLKLYLGFKVISWIVMRFVDDDKVKKEENTPRLRKKKIRRG